MERWNGLKCGVNVGIVAVDRWGGGMYFMGSRLVQLIHMYRRDHSEDSMVYA
jgi:hypothetical protein